MVERIVWKEETPETVLLSIGGVAVAVVRSPVISDSLRHHGLQHARLPCPSPPPGVSPNSCPLN